MRKIFASLVCKMAKRANVEVPDVIKRYEAAIKEDINAKFDVYELEILLSDPAGNPQAGKILYLVMASEVDSAQLSFGIQVSVIIIFMSGVVVVLVV